MTLDEAVGAFAAAIDQLPSSAMEWALAHWDEAGPNFVACLDACASGADRSAAALDALFFIVHLLGDHGETASFQPLCRLLRQDEVAERVLGDAITETISGVLIRTFDGDFDALSALIEDQAAAEFARGAALDAMAYLTREGRGADDAMRDYLRHLHAGVEAEPDSWIWASWIMAVANLGYEDMAPMAEELIRRDIPAGLTTIRQFRKDLRRAVEDPDRMAGFLSDLVQPFHDAIGTLRDWHPFKDAGDDGDAGQDFGDESDFAPVETHVNPLRHVGRNDPCPCGSGKKYKKCCLGKALPPG